MTDQLEAQLADAEERREAACEEANTAAEERDGYRRELARVRAQVRELEEQLRAERHEHAETRARLLAAQATRDEARERAMARYVSEIFEGLGLGRIRHAKAASQAPTAYDLNPTAAQLASFRSHR